MHDKHLRRLQACAQLAADLSPMTRGKHGAQIYLGNTLLASGVSSLRTHPLQAKFGRNPDAICLHAEIAAIVAAIRRLSNGDFSRATLYVARWNNNDVRYSRPCAGCERALVAFGFCAVYYSIDNSTYGVM